MKDYLKAAVRERMVLARGLISDPAKWTKGAFARTREDRVCGVRTVGAVKFCMSGAMGQIGSLHDDLHAEAIKVVMEAMDAQGTDQRFVSNWNDAPERTHEEVLAMFDKAIALVTP